MLGDKNGLAGKRGLLTIVWGAQLARSVSRCNCAHAPGCWQALLGEVGTLGRSEPKPPPERPLLKRLKELIDVSLSGFNGRLVLPNERDQAVSHLPFISRVARQVFRKQLFLVEKPREGRGEQQDDDEHAPLRAKCERDAGKHEQSTCIHRMPNRGVKPG